MGMESKVKAPIEVENGRSSYPTYTVYTALMGCISFQYIRMLNKYYMVSRIEDTGNYKIIRPLTFSEICYVNPYLSIRRR